MTEKMGESVENTLKVTVFQVGIGNMFEKRDYLLSDQTL